MTKLASPFGHPTQVRTQGQLATTCVHLPYRLAGLYRDFESELQALPRNLLSCLWDRQLALAMIFPSFWASWRQSSGQVWVWGGGGVWGEVRVVNLWCTNNPSRWYVTAQDPAGMTVDKPKGMALLTCISWFSCYVIKFCNQNSLGLLNLRCKMNEKYIFLQIFSSVASFVFKTEYF